MKKMIKCVGYILRLIIVGCMPMLTSKKEETENGATLSKPMAELSKETVKLTAEDNTTLFGTYYDAPGEGVILLHQYRLDRTSWDHFATELQRIGYAVIAIDLRGHGESQGKWDLFSEDDFIAMIKDAAAADAFLQRREKSVGAVIGASIGANIAFKFSSERKIPAVLLSPGLCYHGIDINDVTSTAPTLMIVGKKDIYSYDSSREMDKNNLFGEHQFIIVEGTEHGTYLLTHPVVIEAIYVFLADHCTRVC